MLKRILGLGTLILCLGGIYFYRQFQSQVDVGAGYVAHQICSCVFVAERDHASCRPDLLPAMDQIESEIVEVEGRSGVRARVPLLANRLALHSPGLGCALD